LSTPSDHQNPALWPVSEVKVDKLFGDLSFGVSLDPVATLLTGENGSGKSTLLKALNLVAEEHWWDFAYLPLEGLELTFNSGESLRVTHTDDGLRIEAGEFSWNYDLEVASQIDRRLLAEIKAAPQRYLVSQERGRPRDRVLVQDRLLRHRGVPQQAIEVLISPEWLIQMTNRFNTKLISARRLEHKLRPDIASGDEDTPVPVVEQYALDLRDKMRDALSAYAAESRKQEKNLPAQIVSAMQTTPTVSAEELASDVDELRGVVRDLADSLANVGLSMKRGTPNSSSPNTHVTKCPFCSQYVRCTALLSSASNGSLIYGPTSNCSPAFSTTA
jgi:energy-coupling factor transporter ATP-binding protein EcfA2